MIQVKNIDHIVLTVTNIGNTILFYEKVLNIKCETFANNRKALLIGKQKINLHQLGNEFEPKAKHTLVGCGDLCFIIDTPLTQAIEHLKNMGIEIIEGPANRTGTHGKIISVYFRDPDGNLIEISNYI